jgi:hypothetical protein
VTTIEEVPRVEEEEVFVQGAPGQLSQPRGVAVDDEGNAYVADFGNDRIQKFDAQQQFVKTWGERGDLLGQFRLEHLCRYVLRPPIAQGALELDVPGSILLRLRRPWRDGTWAVRFAPTELLEKLAAMIPKPRINLLVYHGAFAPHARRRPEAVRRARDSALRPEGGLQNVGRSTGCSAASAGRTSPCESAEPGAQQVPQALAPPGRSPPPVGADHALYARPKHYAWADLLRRTFAIDVLECPGCGGRLRLVATIAHPPTIAAILRHLGLPVDVPVPAGARRTQSWASP